MHEHAWPMDHGTAGTLPDHYTEDDYALGIGPDTVGHTAMAEWAGERQAMTERWSCHVQTGLRLDPAPDGTIHDAVTRLSPSERATGL
jgi:hypothetical protein